ncbi:DUF2254 domain-containing protein [Gloeothece verrucosa]|uniref:DUF2254 domain-containing protein n=1 Tax=Gloeothece verrucosa (strain PCC 7822) TaxID=497965 RepID=E0ULU4_GLOV7|nr:DUF2254 domain-containing protein [Gloeothece verrucosa]ADN17924.1 Protein of unknown function DUF2254, membrane [Gloeothece verrucosa PCC 7822]
MKSAKLSKIWDVLHTSYWFVPTVMAISSVGLAFIMLILDQKLGSGLVKKLGWIYTGGPDGARAVLSTIAGSMITVTGTVFSITIVALSLASSQFGPRLLRNFMKDTGNQIVLGTFISTFIYCLLILRTVHGHDYEIFIPQISVTVAIILAMISIGVLIFFIHHAAQSIQADIVIAEVSNDLNQAIDSLFPGKLGHKSSLKPQQPSPELLANFDNNYSPILAQKSGYIQAVDEEKLLKIAKYHNLIIKILQRPGNFIIKGSVLVLIFPREFVNKHLIKQINQIFILGSHRTQQQDVKFTVDQLVEIAIRALSPGINDPFTAISCIDRLSQGLCRLVEREIPSSYRYDENNQLRIIANPVTFEGMVDAAFNQIRQNVSSSVAVRIRLLEALAEIAAHTDNDDYRQVLMIHSQMVNQDALERISEKRDLKDIQKRYLATLKNLK